MKKTNLPKVCHLTTVHQRYDTRIFVKECSSLAKAGWDVNLVVADGKGDENKNDVTIHDIGRPENRIKRMFLFTTRLYKKAMSINADIYHFHDPELLFVGKKLARAKKKVVYDAHEDVPRQILSKPYLPVFFRKGISRIVEALENRAAKKFDMVIAATDHIRERFLGINPSSFTVFNFPFLSEFENFDSKGIKKKDSVCYVGGISEVRGIYEMVEACGLVKKRLTLGGVFQPPEFKNKLMKSNGWQYVDFVGFLNRDRVVSTLLESRAGLVTLHPAINYIDALPVKMFEYMAAGLPVIASDFPLWKDIVEESKCGICVDPMKPESIAEAIEEIFNNEDKAREFGENGRNAVLNRYNWEFEERKLVSYYKGLF